MVKKAQGLSLNTIVIAGIVIIVMIVLIGIFTGYLGNWVPQFKEATLQSCDGGRLASSTQQCNADEREVFGNYGDNQRCCKLKDSDNGQEPVELKTCDDEFGVCRGPIGNCKDNGGTVIFPEKSCLSSTECCVFISS